MLPPPRPLVHELAAGIPGLPIARARLRQWLEGTVEDGAVRQDLLLVGTEMCTEAAQRQASGRISLRAWVDDRTVVLEVTGPALRPGEAAVPTFSSSPSDGRWRTRILERMCDEVSTTTGTATRTVRCRKRTTGTGR